jgi:hypothetical protein
VKGAGAHIFAGDTGVVELATSVRDPYRVARFTTQHTHAMTRFFFVELMNAFGDPGLVE